MAYNFFRYDFQGLDEHGNPVYSPDKITIMDRPKGLEKVARLWYDTGSAIFADVEHAGSAGKSRLYSHEDYYYQCRPNRSWYMTAMLVNKAALYHRIISFPIAMSCLRCGG